MPMPTEADRQRSENAKLAAFYRKWLAAKSKAGTAGFDAVPNPFGGNAREEMRGVTTPAVVQMMAGQNKSDLSGQVPFTPDAVGSQYGGMSRQSLMMQNAGSAKGSGLPAVPEVGYDPRLDDLDLAYQEAQGGMGGAYRRHLKQRR